MIGMNRGAEMPGYVNEDTAWMYRLKGGGGRGPIGVLRYVDELVESVDSANEPVPGGSWFSVVVAGLINMMKSLLAKQDGREVVVFEQPRESVVVGGD